MSHTPVRLLVIIGSLTISVCYTKGNLYANVRFLEVVEFQQKRGNLHHSEVRILNHEKNFRQLFKNDSEELRN